MIKDCIYNTDPNWVTFLRHLGIDGEVNFWRKSQKRVLLNRGAYFYFKLRGEYSIIGRGSFRSFRLLTVEEAWNDYKERNGVQSITQFRQRLDEIYGVGMTYSDPMSCIILDNLIWLDNKNKYHITPDIFPPKVLASKYHIRGTLPELEAVFASLSPERPIISEVHEAQEIYNPTLSSEPSQVSDIILEDIEELNPAFASDFSEPSDSAIRQLSQTYRIIRDTTLAVQIKQLYKYRCQLCGGTIEAPSGEKYAEAHHIKPLGSPHNGPDVAENIVCLCPNCHAKLDYGIIQIEKRNLNVHVDHSVSPEFIRYHNEVIYNKIL